MTLQPRVNLVTLGVADVAAATAFYERLGWKKSSASQQTISFIKLDNLVLALFSRKSLAEDAGVDDGNRAFGGFALAQNLASAKTVDEAFAHAVSCGAKPVKPPEKVFWGGYSGYFADPDGHLWELAYNPFAPLNEKGYMTLPD